MEEKLNDKEKIDENNDKEEEYKIKTYKFIMISLFTIIFLIIIISLYFFLSVGNKKREEQAYFCEEGEEDKCLKCQNNKCLNCNIRYQLIDGKCKATFSVRAKYETKIDNENIDLIYIKFKDNIINMNIDEKEIIPSKNFTFKLSGIHTVYMAFNTSNINDLSAMFY